MTPDTPADVSAAAARPGNNVTAPSDVPGQTAGAPRNPLLGPITALHDGPTDGRGGIVRLWRPS